MGGRAQGRKGPADQPESEGKRPGHAANGSLTQPPKGKPARQPRQEKPVRPAKAQAPSKPAKASAPKSDKSKSSRRPSRRGPMEVTLRLGSQKDSTEQQGSLMKPYYFNPDED